MTIRILLAALLVCGGAAAPAADTKNRVTNGGFEAGDGGGATGWDLAAGATVVHEPVNHFLRLQVGEPRKMVNAHRQVPVGGQRALRLSFRARWQGVKRGAQPWHDARIMLDFKSTDGQTVKPGFSHPYFTGSSDGWQSRSLTCTVPAGAATLTIMPCLFEAEAGTFDIDDLLLTPVDEAAVVVKAVEARPEPVVDAGGQPPQALHVDGNRLLRADGTPVWLQGVSIDSLQWSNSGEDIVRSVVTAIESWKANVVRLPMRENRWFGRAEGQTDGGAAYRAVIAQAVQAAASRGCWLILDLHKFRAPEAVDVEFWTDAATAWKDHPAVIFELFNEPHDIPWEVWRDGGDVTDRRKGGVVAENQARIVRFRTPGMQALVDAVRATGARNLILAGGLDYAYDLSGILTGSALKEPGGNGIAYVTHVYPWKRDWQKRFLDVVAVHPVVMTEVGCDAVRYDFIPASAFEDPYTWAPDMVACIQTNRIHWTAFSFHPSCGPPMLMDRTAYTPTPFWGSFVRAALLGTRFGPGRLR